MGSTFAYRSSLQADRNAETFSGGEVVFEVEKLQFANVGISFGTRRILSQVNANFAGPHGLSCWAFRMWQVDTC